MSNEIVLGNSAPLQPVSTTFEQAKSSLNESIWQQLATITVKQALSEWVSGLDDNTRINYNVGFKKLAELDLVDQQLSVQQFSFVNHETVIDAIKRVSGWSEATKQARAAAYISFTGFLQRRTQGMVRKAIANKDGANKTFFKTREKVKTHALDQTQTRRFLQIIETISKRDALIAKLILQGGKRKKEVLTLKVDQIYFEKRQIVFEQSKTRGIQKRTVINYPDHIMHELQAYIQERKGLVFVTRNNKPIAVTQIDRNFIKAGIMAGIPFRVTPHVLRVTLVTRLKELKIQDSDIMKITGHASPAQLASYDKSDLGNNASFYHHFV
jgi:integrase